MNSQSGIRSARLHVEERGPRLRWGKTQIYIRGPRGKRVGQNTKKRRSTQLVIDGRVCSCWSSHAHRRRVLLPSGRAKQARSRKRYLVQRRPTVCPTQLRLRIHWHCWIDVIACRTALWLWRRVPCQAPPAAHQTKLGQRERLHAHVRNSCPSPGRGARCPVRFRIRLRTLGLRRCRRGAPTTKWAWRVPHLRRPGGRLRQDRPTVAQSRWVCPQQFLHSGRDEEMCGRGAQWKGAGLE